MRIVGSSQGCKSRATLILSGSSSISAFGMLFSSSERLSTMRVNYLISLTVVIIRWERRLKLNHTRRRLPHLNLMSINSRLAIVCCVRCTTRLWSRRLLVFRASYFLTTSCSRRLTLWLIQMSIVELLNMSYRSLRLDIILAISMTSERVRLFFSSFAVSKLILILNIIHWVLVKLLLCSLLRHSSIYISTSCLIFRSNVSW